MWNSRRANNPYFGAQLSTVQTHRDGKVQAKCPVLCMDIFAINGPYDVFHGNEVLPKDTTYLIQRPCYQQKICAKIHQAVGPHEDLLTIIKRCKLMWYGYVSNSSGRAKTILQDTVKEGRRQGRQTKKWEDNTRKWTGLEFTKSKGQWRTEKNGRNDPHG